MAVAFTYDPVTAPAGSLVQGTLADIAAVPDLLIQPAIVPVDAGPTSLLDLSGGPTLKLPDHLSLPDLHVTPTTALLAAMGLLGTLLLLRSPGKRRRR